MEKALLLSSLFFFLQCTNAQKDSANHQNKLVVNQGEFVIYDNGLIYDRSTMSRLGRVVDSLNLRFKNCDVKEYRSFEQGYGTYISITKNVRRAREAMLQNMSLADFLKKFKTEDIKKNLWVVKERTVSDGSPSITYHSEGADHIQIEVQDVLESDKVNGWIYQDYNDALDIFYLRELKSSVIPERYARLIQYVDCMIDTTATIYSNKESDPSIFPPDPDSKVKKFIDLTMDFEPRPTAPNINDLEWKEVYEQYNKDYEDWDIRRLQALDAKMQREDNIKLLKDAVEESILKQNGILLDVYAQRYLPPAKALELERSFRVYGACSMDRGPRNHAVSICKLAAETSQWDIFLRAHLDILNDNFERASDGSWARRTRGTYIKELEVLNINAVSLLIGTGLYSENVNKNHYTGGAWRTGKALAESKDKAEVENILFSMVQDKDLDLYNRMEAAYTFISYNQSLNDAKVYLSNIKRIKAAVTTLPDGLDKRYLPVLED